MAVELLFEAYKKYIEPLLEFGWVYLNDQGFIVEREQGNRLYFINDKYKGLPGESPKIYPVVPLNDEHYLAIKESPEQEVFNPFRTFKYMQLVMLEFKRGLIPSCISDEAGKKHSLEEQEDLIRFHYEKSNGMYTTGFVNTEDEENLKLLYSYIGNDILEATWGLCVMAYNDADRRHADYFYNIKKSWDKAKRLSGKWEDERRKILPKMKVIQQESLGFQHIDLSDQAANKISSFGKDYYVGQEYMDAYLLSLFNVYNLELAPGMQADEASSPISRKERTWQYPDFASDEVIFGNKKTKEKTVTPPGGFNKEEAIDVVSEVIKEAKEDTPNGEGKTIIAGQYAGPEENDKAALIPQKEEAPSPAKPFTPFDPNVGVPPMLPPFIPGPFPPFSFGNPMMGMGGPPMAPPMMPFNPMMAGNPFAGPMPMLPMTRMPNQDVPQDINQIDFESKDHPDPFSSYR
jgi:hypothetical protein